MKQSCHTVSFMLGCIVMLGASTAQSAPVTLQQPTATFSQSAFGNFSIATAIDGNVNPLPFNGWAIFPNETAQTAVFETSTDLFTNGGSLTFTLQQSHVTPTEHTIGRFRLSATTDNRSLFADGLATGGDVVANWVILDPTSATSANGATLTELGDHSILASGTSPATDTYTVSATTTLGSITGLRLEVLEDASLPFNGPGRQSTNGNFVLTEFTVDAVAATTTVPEPASLLLLGSGLVGFAAWRHRRQA